MLLDWMGNRGLQKTRNSEENAMSAKFLISDPQPLDLSRRGLITGAAAIAAAAALPSPAAARAPMKDSLAPAF